MKIPSLGEVVSERYRLIRELGTGGMAIVFEVKHLGTGRLHAMKMVIPKHATNADFVEMFLKEAKFAGRIGRHRNIVNITDTGTDSNSGLPFIVMELLSGSDLQQYIKEHGSLPSAELVKFMRQLGKALGHVHKGGVVHRDLKPTNLFMVDDEDGGVELRILDFGISKVLSDTQQMTATAIGTLGYAAPEQLGEGLRKMAARNGVTIARTISPATDIWAIAMVAYELLTSRSPLDYWGSETMADFLITISSGDERLKPSATAAVPAGFDAWFLRHTTIDASERPTDAQKAIAEFCDIFREAFALPVTVPLGPPQSALVAAPIPVPVVSSVPSVSWRRGVLVLMGLAGAAGAVGVMVDRVSDNHEVNQIERATTEPSSRPTVVSPSSAAASGRSALPVPSVALAGVADMRFVSIPAGQFLMGSPEGKGMRDERPQHEVTLAAFELGQTEVTQGQWEAVMGGNPSDCNYGCRAEYPVNSISWWDALKFMNKLSEREKLMPCYVRKGDEVTWRRDCTGFRFPTEAEWEYAARAGTQTAWSFGDDEKEICKYANVEDVSWGKKHKGSVTLKCDDGYSELAPVARKTANPWKLYDVHGNVWEWAWDWYVDSYDARAVSNPTGPAGGEYRVLRGGSFFYGPVDARSADRGGYWPGNRNRRGGLRVARGPHP